MTVYAPFFETLGHNLSGRHGSRCSDNTSVFRYVHPFTRDFITTILIDFLDQGCECDIELDKTDLNMNYYLVP